VVAKKTCKGEGAKGRRARYAQRLLAGRPPSDAFGLLSPTSYSSSSSSSSSSSLPASCTSTEGKGRSQGRGREGQTGQRVSNHDQRGPHKLFEQPDSRPTIDTRGKHGSACSGVREEGGVEGQAPQRRDTSRVQQKKAERRLQIHFSFFEKAHTTETTPILPPPAPHPHPRNPHATAHMDTPPIICTRGDRSSGNREQAQTQRWPAHDTLQPPPSS
jgi:hypothetical protein